jgi:DNA-binding Lrp family transcriptional regulator
MRNIDEQERQILKALVRNPRHSDNRISILTGVPVRTVARKRARLEDEGILSYYAGLNFQAEGLARFNTQHLVIIRFKIGITLAQIMDEIRNEPNVANIFSEHIRDSFVAEVDGHIALTMVIEGESDSDVTESLQGEIIPSLRKNHGEDSIEELKTVRLLGAIRREHNYLPWINMEAGKMKDDWPDDALFVG